MKWKREKAPQAGHWCQRKERGVNETYSPFPSPSPYLWNVNITSTDMYGSAALPFHTLMIKDCLYLVMKT